MGFDLKSPNAQTIGQNNNEAGLWVVAENPASAETRYLQKSDSHSIRQKSDCHFF
jgi:hypothetical protein